MEIEGIGIMKIKTYIDNDCKFWLEENFEWKKRKVGKHIVKTVYTTEVQLYKEKLHSENGPALLIDGIKQWYLNGDVYSEKDWKLKMRKLKMKALGL